MSNGVSSAKKELGILYPILIVSSILILTTYIIWINSGYSYEATLDFFANMEVENIRAFVASFGILAPLVFLILQISQEVVAPLPGVVFMIVGGLLFGTFYGVILSMIGGTIGAFLCFLIAKKYGRPLVKTALNREDFGIIDDLFETKGIWMAAVLRAVPIIPFGFASYFISMTKVSAKDYLIGSILGSIPMTIVWTHAGNYLLNDFHTLLLIGVVLMVFFLLTPVFIIVTKDFLKNRKHKSVQKTG